jgi:hypothetical protein
MIKTDLTIAIPDLISNSYFPIVAASELGYFKREGLEVTLELISPGDKAFAALRSGAVDLVGAEAHTALAVFPNWSGMKLSLPFAAVELRQPLGLRWVCGECWSRWVLIRRAILKLSRRRRSLIAR